MKEDRRDTGEDVVTSQLHKETRTEQQSEDECNKSVVLYTRTNW